MWGAMDRTAAHHNSYAEDLTPNVTIFEIESLVDTLRLNEVVRVGPHLLPSVLIRSGRETRVFSPQSEDTGRRWHLQSMKRALSRH